MWAMNSSVTLDSATSVMSSLCLEINCSNRSKGPSKLSSRSVKGVTVRVVAEAASSTSAVSSPSVPAT